MSSTEEAANSALTIELKTQDFADRSKFDSVEGIRIQDKNIAGNIVVIIGESEFYSVRRVDLLDKDAPMTGRLETVWISKEAEGWLCRKGPIDLSGHRLVRQADLVKQADIEIFKRTLPTAGSPGWVAHARSFGPDEIKKYMFDAVGTDRDPKRIGNEYPISAIFPVPDDEPNVALLFAQSIMDGWPFPQDRLHMAYPFVSKLKSIGDFVACIQGCYKHVRG